MEHIQKLRIKTAMVIYELELSLGNYVIKNENLNELSESGKQKIIDRENERGNPISGEDINLIIEASYLDEIFNFAISITDGTSVKPYIIELKQLCSVLGIFNIRNAVSHPNRPFPDCYWFRAATIASDPLIEKLGLTSVRNALNSAIDENLSAPPEEWLNNVHWAIRNTLPSTFDHEITGLLGRDKEFKDLESVLSKERNNLIAIVAPGGVGKTALVLQYLRDLSLSPIWSNRVSSIVFCTLKNERLTADGIEFIDAVNGIGQIKDSILEDLKTLYNRIDINNFDEVVSLLQDEKILICIDNLETLLIESPKEFLEFNQSLPLKWRVLVTSRISVDSATTVTLEPLVKRHAVNLSRNYLRKRGVVDFKQEELDRIADAANNNPLAIRLTIDLYIRGADIAQSINKSQKDIVAFSYKNLIEALQTTSITILEAIYALGMPTRSDLVDFLKLNNDNLAESINELAKTSLIVRVVDEFGNDVYKLSESIRDLLLINPRNIEVRNSIAESAKKRKSKILEQTARIKQLGLSEFDEEYIPEKTEPYLYSLIVDLNKSLSISGRVNNNTELFTLREKFNETSRTKTTDPLFLFNYSRIFGALKDTTNELIHLLKAEKFDDSSPRIKLGIALRHFYNNDYEDALPYFEYLLGKHYDNPDNSTKRFSFSVIKPYYLCLLYLGRFDKIIELTENWQTKGHWRSILGVSRATALKRKIEYRYGSIESNEGFIKEILKIFDEIFILENYFENACIEANKILKDIIFIASPNFNYSKEIKSLYARFVATHFFTIISKLRGENINSSENLVFLNKVYGLEILNNPLHHVKWYKGIQDESVYDREHIEELIADGFEIVTVYHIPDDRGYGMSSFMFARDSEDNQFYLSVNNFDEGWNRWGYIKENTKLAIKYDEIQANGKTTPATQILEIDQY
ncbi:ATP-binding protein [Chitinophaga sancti]|uniref:ATP-binding protein n=2 Tax=Chitinophaga sancti TaxID=1004 RepID=A0ABZ0XH11_9BACT|nr:ATP-binding protein [Chitinophaga sancti]WQD64477.1 ATP-binding protein [Chitinophaga sancti]WQG89899.1 ATP-binding protein [Chitinophaga sancti]